MKNLLQRSFRQENGQSLVEVALFFPILIILLAGVIEVSHLAITQNRVSNAATASSRFASNGGENAGMPRVALNSVTQTLDISEGVWDIWSIRGTVNADGTGFQTWEFQHLYGISNTHEFVQVSEADVMQEVLEELSESEANIGGLRLVGTLALHDVNSILGLESLQELVGFKSMRGFNVQRVFGDNVDQTVGCSGFPIVVHEGVRSVTPPGTGSNPFPDAGDFTYPSSPAPSYQSFIYHTPDVPLENAQEGYVYRVQNGFGTGSFGWLLWNAGRPGSANSLAGSLSWPGDSQDYFDHGDNNIYPAAAAYPHIVRGYVNPLDNTDTAIHIGDWITANTGAVNSNEVRNQLNQHIDRERTLRLFVWNESESQGNNGRYRIKGYAVFRLIGYRLQGNESWILAEFIRWDNSCGQQ